MIKAENIVAILLASIQKEHSGLLGIFSARSIITGGPLVQDNNLEILNLILKEYRKIVNKRVIYSQFRNIWLLHDNEKRVFAQNGFEYEEHLNILIDITKSSDELWMDLKKARKEGVRKAKRNNLIFNVSSSCDVLPNFYELLKITYSNIELPYPEIDFFQNLLENMPQNNIKIFTLKKEERIIVALVALIHNSRL